MIPYITHMNQKISLKKALHHRYARCCGQKIAPECGSVSPGRKARGNLIHGHQRPDGDTSSQGFGQCHDVGFHVKVFVSKKPSRPAQTHLHLIEDEE